MAVVFFDRQLLIGIAQANDGTPFDGIIERLDEEGIAMLVPEEFDAEGENVHSNRQKGLLKI